MEAQQSRSTDRRPLAESAGRRNGKGLEAAAEVLKGAGGSLGGATKQEHRSEAFGRGSCIGMEARATGSGKASGAAGDGFRLLTGPSGSPGTEWALQGTAERGAKL